MASERGGIVVNGRFLVGASTGVHRNARLILDVAREAELPLEVIAPPGADDPRVDRVLWGPAGRAGGQIWEQVFLPAVARGRAIMSLANTAPLASRRSVVFIHDAGPLVGPQWFSRSGRVYGWVMMTAARRGRGILVPTEQVRRELIGFGFEAERIFVVRPVVDPSFRRASPTEVQRIRDMYGLERPYVLHVGWSPRKDVGTVALAHRRIVGESPHDLVLVGAAHPNLSRVKIIDAPTIRRLGYVADSDMSALLTGASALVFPTLYEGFGLPPLEAVACGTPAIVSDLPVLRETGGDAVHYVAPGDVEAWAAALTSAVRGGLSVGGLPVWSRADTRQQLVGALEALSLL